MFMSRQLPILLLMPAVLVPLTSCTSPQHGPEEKYFLIATNIKVPYWQTAQAGLNRAGAQLQVRTEFVGPDTYDPKAQHDEFQRVLKQKPTGILISAGDPKLMQPDIDAAIAQGVPVITIDSDADSSKRLLFIGTDNYKAGMMGGEVVAKHLNGKGNVVIYTMPEQANLNQRLRGYQEALAAVDGAVSASTVPNPKREPVREAAKMVKTVSLVPRKAPIKAINFTSPNPIPSTPRARR